MRFKLDENLGRTAQLLLRDHGHDASAVVEQELTGTTDVDLADHCASEARCLVTLDLDFSNPIQFPPDQYSGIAVLRLPSPIAEMHLRVAIETLARHLEESDIVGSLWIIELGRVREYSKDR